MKKKKLVNIMHCMWSTLVQQHEKAAACFGAQHPDARWWMPGSGGFHDFKWYSLEVEQVYYVGGFGGAHYIGWIDKQTYLDASARREEELQLARGVRFQTQ